MKTKIEKRFLECRLSNKDLIRAAEEISSCRNELQKMKFIKKELLKKYSKQIKQLEKRSTELSDLIICKVEDREIECAVKFHEPFLQKKSIYRNDTGELVGIEEMTLEECQEEMEFNKKLVEV
ncbi:MAG: hypothetical protein K1X66_02275 [Verrucomicrobiae bacterium]|nr:hypothetical protein [Verrucomicrobiae bacterium]